MTKPKTKAVLIIILLTLVGCSDVEMNAPISAFDVKKCTAECEMQPVSSYESCVQRCQVNQDIKERFRK